MGIASFSKRDYLYLAPKSYKCPLCGKEHTYNNKYYDKYDCKEKNRPLAHYQSTGYKHLTWTCSALNDISISFDAEYCYWEIHGFIDKSGFSKRIDSKGKIPLENMEDREDGTITLYLGRFDYDDIYLTFIYDHEKSFETVYSRKIKAEIAVREEKVLKKERELNAREKNLQAKEQEKRERDLRNLEHSLEQKEKELKALEQKLQEVKKTVLTALNPI